MNKQKIFNAVLFILISVFAARVWQVSFLGIEAIRIGFGSLFIMLGGMLLGPIYGAIIGIFADIFSFLLQPGNGMQEYLPQITILNGLWGVLPWYLFKWRKFTIYIKDLFFIIGIPQVLFSVFAMSFIIHNSFEIPLIFLLRSRFTAQLITIPVYVLITYVIFKNRESEDALRKSEERNRAILNTLPDLMFIFSRDGYYLDYNAPDERLLVLDPKQFLGQSVSEVLPKEVAELLLQSFEEAYKTDELHIVDYPLEVGGDLRYFEARTTSIDEDRLMTIIRDITFRKEKEDEIRKQKERLASILEGTNAGTWEWNVQTGETILNQRWAEIIGYTLEELAPISIETWTKYTHPEDLESSNRMLEKHFAGEIDYYDLECRMKHKEGHWIWVQDRGKVISWTEDAKPLWMFGTHQDITERKQSEKRLNTMMNNTPDMVVRFNTDLQHIYCNEAVERELGIPPDFFIGRSLLDLEIPDLENLETEKIKSVHQFLVKCLETGQKQYCNTEFMTPSGFKYYSTIIIPERNNRDIESLLAVTRDITEQKQAEEAIKKSEERIQQMLSLVPDMISIHDPEMNIIYSNWNGFGRVPQEKRLLNTKCYRTYRGLEDIYPDCQAVSVLQTKEAFQKEIELPEGMWIDLRVIPLLNQDGSVEFFMEWVRDITKPKQMEQRIQESNEKLSGILNNMEDVVWSVSWPDLNPIYISPSVEMLTGRNIDNFVHNPYFFKEITYPDDQHLIENSMEQLIECGEATRESRIVKPNGNIIWVYDKLQMIYDENHQPIRVEGLAQDITERKQMEDKIQYQHEYQKIVANISYSFINTPSSLIDEAINSTLYQIGTFFHVDRAYLVDFSPDDKTMSNTHEWCREGIEPQKERFQDHPIDDFPWGIEEIRSREYVFIPDVDVIEFEEERAELQLQEIQSLLLIPIKIQERVTGFIGMDSVRKKMIWKDDEIILLKVISETISSAFLKHQMEQELIQQNQEVELLNQHLNQEIEKAHGIHNNILPEELPRIKGISFAAFYQPAETLGGDFYDIIKVDNRLIIYLSDISGHGLDGSMINFFVKESIDSYIVLKPNDLSPSKILRHLERQFRRENYPDRLFICIFLAVLDIETLELTYAGAGFQDTPFVRQGDGKKTELCTKGLFINSIFSTSQKDFQEKTILLSSGSTIFFNTDGLTEQGEPGAFYMERLSKVFYENAHLPPDRISQAVVQDFKCFNNGSLQGDDDITFLILQVEPENRRDQIELATDFDELNQLKKGAVEILPEIGETDVLISCLYELAANAMEHGNQMDPTKRVRVEFLVFPGYMQVSVEDEGDGFNWRDKVDKPLELEGLTERGRGITMTSILCDNLYYNDEGNKVTCVVNY